VKETWAEGHPTADAACRAMCAGDYVDVLPAVPDGDTAICKTKLKSGGAVSDCGSVSKDKTPQPEKDAPEKAEENSAAQDAAKSGNENPADSAASAAPDPSDRFKSKCIGQLPSSFEPQINEAYKAKYNPGGNVAVLEWKAGGKRRVQWFNSDGAHSEEVLLDYMGSNGIPKEAVTRIFSELSPCAAKCLPALSDYFKGVRKNITLEFRWVHNQEADYRTCTGQPAKQIRQESRQARYDRLKSK
jgi:hypothetical protein